MYLGAGYFFTGVGLSLSAAICAYALAQVVYGPTSTLPLTVASATFAGGVLVAGALLLLRGRRRLHPGPLARRADSLFATRELFSTATEIAGRGPSSAIDHALLDLAADKAQLIEMRGFIPERWGRWVVLAITAPALAILGANLWTDAALRNEGAVAALDAPVSARELAGLVEAIENAARNAEAISRDFDDPYTRAIGRELSRLAKDLTAATPMTRDEINQRIDHLRRAARYAMSTDGLERPVAALAEAVENIQSALGGGDQPDTAAPGHVPTGAPQQAAPDPTGESPEAVAPDLAQTGPQSTDISMAWQPRMGAQAGEDDAAGVFQDGPCIHDGDLDCFMISDPTLAESVLLERSGSETAEGLPSQNQTGAQAEGVRIGASFDSGSGLSFEAGRGQAELGNDNADLATFATGEDVVLPDIRRDGDLKGATVFRAPDALTDQSASGQPAQVVQWRKLDEASVWNGLSSLSQSDAISAYFRYEAD